MEFKEIVQKRYATKKFDGKKIPQEKVDQLIELMRFSASSFNIQPWKIVIVTNQKVKDELQKHAWNQQQVGTASHVLVLCADTNTTALIDKLAAHIKGADQYIAMMRDFDTKLSDSDKKNWAQKQVYIAMGNALNGATSLGFDSCPMEGFDPSAFSKILNLPSNIIPTVVVPIGYAADTPRPKFRFATTDIVLHN